MKSLSDSGLEIDLYEGRSSPALYFALVYNKTEIARFLVDQGADVDLIDQYGTSLLNYTIEGDKIEMLQLLIEIGADVNLRDKNGPPLNHALKQFGGVNPDVIQLLIKHGAKPDETDVSTLKLLQFGSPLHDYRSISEPGDPHSKATDREVFQHKETVSRRLQ